MLFLIGECSDFKNISTKFFSQLEKISFFFFFFFSNYFTFLITQIWKGAKGNFFKKKLFTVSYEIREYLTLRSVSSLNNPQNTEMKFCENI